MLPGVKNKLILFIAIAALFLLLNSSLLGRILFPIYYKDEVVKAAETYSVDPYLMLAIIQVESKFKEATVSKKGAVGLMQVMPETAKWVVEQANFSRNSLDNLREPRVNIHIGSWYLNYLQNKFDANRLITIAAYNAGPGNVEKWINQGIWDGTYKNIEQIPFGETRDYVQRVIYFYDRYKKIYDELQATGEN